MPLGTLDRSPPSLFKQGPSAFSQALFLAVLAIFLMVADARFRVVEPVRAVIATVVIPVQRAFSAPVTAWKTADDYIEGVSAARAREAQVLQRLAAQSTDTVTAKGLANENARLRGLLELRPRLSVRSVPTEILYDAPDPFSRKVIIDRGITHGVLRGAPLVNEFGVLGQVTRTYPLTSEVTLLTDRDAAIPILNSRTQQRGAAYGDPLSLAMGGGMELRFMASNADVMAGDVLQTSGADGVYPPGLPVAKVVQVDRRADSSFAKVLLTPIAVSDAVRLALVLEPLSVQMPPRPQAETAQVLRRGAAASAAAAAPSAAPAAAPAPAQAVVPAAPPSATLGAPVPVIEVPATPGPSTAAEPPLAPAPAASAASR